MSVFVLSVVGLWSTDLKPYKNRAWYQSQTGNNLQTESVTSPMVSLVQIWYPLSLIQILLESFITFLRVRVCNDELGWLLHYKDEWFNHSFQDISGQSNKNVGRSLWLTVLNETFLIDNHNRDQSLWELGIQHILNVHLSFKSDSLYIWPLFRIVTFEKYWYRDSSSLDFCWCWRCWIEWP